MVLVLEKPDVMLVWTPSATLDVELLSKEMNSEVEVDPVVFDDNDAPVD